MLGRSCRANCKIHGRNKSTRGFFLVVVFDLYLEKTSKTTKTSIGKANIGVKIELDDFLYTEKENVW